MNTLLREEDLPVEAAPKPLQWSWISQRQATDGKAASIWKLGFIAPDGAEMRVTFHEISKPATPSPAATPAAPTPAPDATPTPPKPPAPEDVKEDFPPQGGGGQAPPQAAPAPPPAQAPDTSSTDNSQFYVTFFTNRNPHHFMKWDVSLSHEDSLIVWMTVTHGLVDFMRKAKPSNLILDDLGNGKLKMVLRSVSMDVAEANPEYELEITKKHALRGYYQIKKRGETSAFDAAVKGKENEGATQIPQAPSPDAALQQPKDKAVDVPDTTQMGQKPADPTADTGIAKPAQAQDVPPNPQDPQAPKDPVAPKETPSKKGLTVEIGKDYTIAVKDKDDNAVDRYRAKNPADMLRWLNVGGYGNNRMIIVDKEQPSGKKQKKMTQKPEPNTTAAPVLPNPPKSTFEDFVIDGKKIRVLEELDARQAAMMNYILNADKVLLEGEFVSFEFASDKDMEFKKALVEIAYNNTYANTFSEAFGGRADALGDALEKHGYKHTGKTNYKNTTSHHYEHESLSPAGHKVTVTSTPKERTYWSHWHKKDGKGHSTDGHTVRHLHHHLGQMHAKD